MSQPLTQIYEVYIRTTPAKLWEAMTRGDFTRKYYAGCTLDCDWAPGSPMVYTMEDGRIPFDAAVEAIEPERRLVHSFKPRPNDWPGDTGDPPSRVTYEIEQLGASCLLRVTHEHFAGETRIFKGTRRGWQIILSGLKTLLETGQPLEIAFPEEASVS